VCWSSSRADFEAAVDDRPEGFGDQPGTYHSDAIFLMGVDAAAAMTAFSPKEGVDAVWPGDGLIYSQRLSAQPDQEPPQSHRVVAALQVDDHPSWQTTLALMDLVKAVDDGEADGGAA
jgi:hypothetical protein